MGTNYYLKGKACPVCKHEEGLHIGKSSAGWCFGLHVYPDDEWAEEPNGKPKSLADWVERFNNPIYTIEDDYGTAVSPSDMIDNITIRSHPRGLSRHTGLGCIGLGEGTYDLMVGEFF